MVTAVGCLSGGDPLNVGDPLAGQCCLQLKLLLERCGIEFRLLR